MDGEERKDSVETKKKNLEKTDEKAKPMKGYSWSFIFIILFQIGDWTWFDWIQWDE